MWYTCLLITSCWVSEVVHKPLPPTLSQRTTALGVHHKQVEVPWVRVEGRLVPGWPDSCQLVPLEREPWTLPMGLHSACKLLVYVKVNVVKSWLEVIEWRVCGQEPMDGKEEHTACSWDSGKSGPWGAAAGGRGTPLPPAPLPRLPHWLYIKTFLVGERTVFQVVIGVLRTGLGRRGSTGEGQGLTNSLLARLVHKLLGVIAPLLTGFHVAPAALLWPGVSGSLTAATTRWLTAVCGSLRLVCDSQVSSESLFSGHGQRLCFTARRSVVMEYTAHLHPSQYRI